MVVGIYGGGGGSTIVRLSSDGLPSETCQQNASFFDLILAVIFCIADDHSDDADTIRCNRMEGGNKGCSQRCAILFDNRLRTIQPQPIPGLLFIFFFFLFFPSLGR